MNQFLNNETSAALKLGDRLVKEGDLVGAIDAYLKAAEDVEPAPASLCLALARTYARLENIPQAVRWATAVVDAGDDFPAWMAAAALIDKATKWKIAEPRRRARVALAGSFTTSQLKSILPLAALRHGIELDVWETPYGQYRQELLDSKSELYRRDPNFVVLAVHEGELTLPFLSQNPATDVAEEIARWATLWEAASLRSSARVLQFNFALPAEAPMGHLGTRLPASRYAMAQAVNTGLGAAASSKVTIVDCERLSALVGKEKWTDPRYWQLSKQAVSMQALPLLARHLTAVIAADLGLSRKCLVLDLDNTLWGGVIAEDGLAGIKLGGDQTGEAFVAFQEYIRQLKDKGVILAACSKNNESDAKEPFERHPEMRLKLDDFAAFVANWEPKADNLVRIAETLNIGLDSLVFVDDNPVERAAVRRAMLQVDVISLPADPAYYTRTLSQYLMFETTTFTAEDTRRTEQYRARTLAARLEKSAGSLEELWESLEMTATIAPFDELNLPRIVQLIGKTNQFNLTTRRYGQAQLEAFMQDPDCVHFSLRLRDRFTDHGLVALMIGIQRGQILDIDTWLMSCRVIGRTVDRTMLAHLCTHAAHRGAKTIRGLYIPAAKNQLVKDIYSQFGFLPAEEIADGQAWHYDLAAHGPIENRFIKAEKIGEINGRRSEGIAASI
jgi:FkbH-like protein